MVLADRGDCRPALPLVTLASRETLGDVPNCLAPATFREEVSGKFKWRGTRRLLQTRSMDLFPSFLRTAADATLPV